MNCSELIFAARKSVYTIWRGCRVESSQGGLCNRSDCFNNSYTIHPATFTECVTLITQGHNDDLKLYDIGWATPAFHFLKSRTYSESFLTPAGPYMDQQIRIQNYSAKFRALRVLLQMKIYASKNMGIIVNSPNFQQDSNRTFAREDVLGIWLDFWQNTKNSLEMLIELSSEIGKV